MISKVKKKVGFTAGAFISAMILCAGCNSDSSKCHEKMADKTGLVRSAIQHELRQLDLEKIEAIGPSVENFLARFPDCCRLSHPVEPPWYQVPIDLFLRNPASIVRVVYKLENDLYVEKITEFDKCGKIIGDFRSYSTVRPESY